MCYNFVFYPAKKRLLLVAKETTILLVLELRITWMKSPLSLGIEQRQILEKRIVKTLKFMPINKRAKIICD